MENLIENLIENLTRFPESTELLIGTPVVVYLAAVRRCQRDGRQ